MPTYQVWSKDRYNRHDILTILSKQGRPETQWKTPEEALAAARRWVHDSNRNNPLTYEEQRRQANNFVFEPNEAGSVYAGNLIHGKHKVLVKLAASKTVTPGVPQEVLLANEATGRFYAGQTPDNTEWYFTDPRGQLVTTLSHNLMEDKTLVFVHQEKE